MCICKSKNIFRFKSHCRIICSYSSTFAILYFTVYTILYVIPVYKLSLATVAQRASTKGQSKKSPL